MHLPTPLYVLPASPRLTSVIAIAIVIASVIIVVIIIIISIRAMTIVISIVVSTSPEAQTCFDIRSSNRNISILVASILRSTLTGISSTLGY